MTGTSDKTAQPGRPRSRARTGAILDAAFAALVQLGYDGLSIDGVAQAAGAGKSTIYRWWPTKADLVIDAFFTRTAAELHFPDTGSARDDFCDQITRLAAFLAGDRGRVLAALLNAGQREPALAAALGQRWLAPRRAWGATRMARALADDELWPDTDPGAALGVLYGPLYTPLLFGGPVPQGAQITAHLAIACRGIFREPA
jgi:AcrR family transcriptional regulator